MREKLSRKKEVARMNLANKITISRIILVPFLISFLFLPGKWGIVISFFIFVLACLSDWVDGYVARKNSQITTMGKIMDPVADKVLVYSMLICFVYLHIVPFWMVIILIARDFLVMALRVEVAFRKVILTPTFTAKFKTVLEYGVILFSFFYMFFSISYSVSFLKVAIYLSMSLTLVFAIVSAVQYLLEGRRILVK
ncbi:CDP-diacylglycerol--glycerol-3-phosphate 3-phosphatidyltransferase [Candidatus Aerophobetes bacterium]|nr:CDP-diacylglycerol--glycerol-3-phosphate 3-phosphatidyltransferase [Candidatus Aerophobetes bacterium]